MLEDVAGKIYDDTYGNPEFRKKIERLFKDCIRKEFDGPIDAMMALVLMTAMIQIIGTPNPKLSDIEPVIGILRVMYKRILEIRDGLQGNSVEDNEGIRIFKEALKNMKYGKDAEEL